jgi:hypothetical protein
MKLKQVVCQWFDSLNQIMIGKKNNEEIMSILFLLYVFLSVYLTERN